MFDTFAWSAVAVSKPKPERLSGIGAVLSGTLPGKQALYSIVLL